jgi:hypothetical protein
MATNRDEQYKILRAYLNPAIRGEKTDAILKAAASGPVHLIDNVEAVNDSLYVVTAKERYLDERLGGKGIIRPAEVGLSDEVFREIGIEVSARKQVRDLIHQLLRIMYGEIYTRATSPASEIETYNLDDGDTLIIQFDDTTPIEVIFQSSQFQNINTATAQEVADAITKYIRKLGRAGSAFASDNGAGAIVTLISDSDGPSSSVRVLGGKAQNVLKFDEIRPTSADFSTQWTLTQVAGGSIRATWTGGADPSVGKVRKGDYVNIYGTAFNTANRGTFTVSAVQGGLVGGAFVEFENPNGIAETTVQGSNDAILFYNPKRRILTSNLRYAAAYQTEPRTLEIFIPATTKVTRRSRIGAAYLSDGGPSTDEQYGPYIYDIEKPFVVGETATSTLNQLDASSISIIDVADASSFPDDQGKLVFGFGTSHEEGPVPYIARPSSSSIRLNPAYKFKKTHPVGTDVCLIIQDYPVEPAKDGSDYAFYVTDSVAGRIYAQQLIKEVAATGIRIIFYILYPGDEGLGKWATPTTEKYYIWGTEDDL